MESKKISLIIMILLVISLIANIMLFLFIKSRGDITGFSIKESPSIAFENDIVEISKADLLKCCSFVNAEGKEDGCYALKGHDCSYCNDYCG